MIILRKYNIKESVKFIFILKSFTLILLIWICYLKSNKRIYGRSIENKYKVQGIPFECYNRLLAKHEIQELRSHTQREFLLNNIMDTNMKNEFAYSSTYGQINKRIKTDLYLYKKGYKPRYSKKNILGKWDCYCEKKVFDKIDDIEKLVEKMQNYKKLLKQKVCYKYVILFILFSLVPLFGLIIPIVFHGYLKKNFKCFYNCQDSAHNEYRKGDDYEHDDEEYPRALISKNTWGFIEIVNSTFLFVSMFIVISVIIYILIKFIKYQRLKACRSKMSIKEYCKFCKSLFI